jgi:hypothetical protein
MPQQIMSFVQAFLLFLFLNKIDFVLSHKNINIMMYLNLLSKKKRKEKEKTLYVDGEASVSSLEMVALLRT